MTGSGAVRPPARVVSNYLRLAITFAAGLIVVRLMAEIGPSALVVYLLMMAGTGFAHVLKVVVQESVIPVLGRSHDSGQEPAFATVYWLSVLASLLAGLFGIAVFAVIWALAGVFETGTLGQTAFGVAVAAGALRTAASAVATVPLNAILVSGRVVAYNLLLSLERLGDLLAAGLALALFAAFGESIASIAFFGFAAAFHLAVQSLCILHARRADPRFRARRRPARGDEIRWVAGIFGWNVAVVVAFLLFLRLATMVINAGYGAGATLVVGLAVTLIGYQRQAAMGLVIGLDAVFARLKGPAVADIGAILLRASYVQTVFSAVSVALLWLFARPLFELWLGSALGQAPWDPDTAVRIFRIMAVGVFCRSVAESWMEYLNGLGAVGRYAPYLLCGAVVYAAGLAGLALSGWPVQTVLDLLAARFSAIYIVLFLGVVPFQAAAVAGFGFRAFLRPLWLPVLATLAATVLCGSLLEVDRDIIDAAICLGLFAALGTGLMLCGPRGGKA